MEKTEIGGSETKSLKSWLLKSELIQPLYSCVTLGMKTEELKFSLTRVKLPYPAVYQGRIWEFKSIQAWSGQAFKE